MKSDQFRHLWNAWNNLQIFWYSTTIVLDGQWSYIFLNLSFHVRNLGHVVVKRYRPWWDLSQGSMVSGGIGMDRVGCDVVQPGGQLFCSNRWGENAWCYFSGLVSLGLESKTPKIVAVFGSCEAEEKKKIIKIGIVQPLTGKWSSILDKSRHKFETPRCHTTPSLFVPIFRPFGSLGQFLIVESQQSV